ncbi:hypothetical protein FNV43_RR13105 [Rhamnella rubrinervis]|uniref:Uncharacterized protein n=1 Tax=Rhamnella rubrinervis TaxID=2594499 RepID=A0A8K0MEV6_9ROSA|nr:hypothetical protein FNV43_RR13105 [Rhamnella rubrinervis]
MEARYCSTQGNLWRFANPGTATGVVAGSHPGNMAIVPYHKSVSSPIGTMSFSTEVQMKDMASNSLEPSTLEVGATQYIKSLESLHENLYGTFHVGVKQGSTPSKALRLVSNDNFIKPREVLSSRFENAATAPRFRTVSRFSPYKGRGKTNLKYSLTDDGNLLDV